MATSSLRRAQKPLTVVEVPEEVEAAASASLMDGIMLLDEHEDDVVSGQIRALPVRASLRAADKRLRSGKPV